jgi:hypothetical protein
MNRKFGRLETFEVSGVGSAIRVIPAATLPVTTPDERYERNLRRFNGDLLLSMSNVLLAAMQR